MKVRIIICTCILFCTTAITVGLLSDTQNLLPYILPIILLLVLFLLDKYLTGAIFIACIFTVLIIILGFVIEYFLSNETNYIWTSFIHLFGIPLTFILYYAMKVSRKGLTVFSLSSLLTLAIINFFFRADLLELDRFGSEKAILEKNVVIINLGVLDKNGRDSIFNFTNGVYLIDIWGLYCPICYSDMVILDSVKKSDSDFQLISLLTYRKQDSFKSIDKINNLGNSYPSFLLQDTALLKRLDINKVPNYLILHKNKIVYRNSLDKVIKKYYELRNS
jgi:thiol-disulfide isomerase/thioredoxin